MKNKSAYLSLSLIAMSWASYGCTGTVDQAQLQHSADLNYDLLLGEIIRMGDRGTETVACQGSNRDKFCLLYRKDAVKLCQMIGGRLPSQSEMATFVHKLSGEPILYGKEGTGYYRIYADTTEASPSVLFYATTKGYISPFPEDAPKVWLANSHAIDQHDAGYSFSPRDGYAGYFSYSNDVRGVICAFSPAETKHLTLTEQLFDAIEKNDPQQVSLLIRSGADPNNEVYRKPISTFEDIPTGLGIDLVQSELKAYTPLIYALWKGTPQILEILLRAKGINTEDRLRSDDLGYPLLQAILKRDLNSAEILLKAGANVNVFGCKNGTHPLSALSMAAGSGLNGLYLEPQLQMVQLLLRYGAKVDHYEVYSACEFIDSTAHHYKPDPEVCKIVMEAKYQQKRALSP